MIKQKEEKNLIVGLDIGTSKIVAIVAELQPDGLLNVIGLGQHSSKGLKKGVVINIDSTMEAIQRAIEEAELMANCKITDVYTGIAGSHIKSINSHGMVKIKDTEVSQLDVDKVIETACAITLPNDQQVLHILTQEYVIDGQEDVRQPLGMSGMKLEVKVHIVTGAIAAAQNIVKCIKRFKFSSILSLLKIIFILLVVLMSQVYLEDRETCAIFNCFLSKILCIFLYSNAI